MGPACYYMLIFPTRAVDPKTELPENGAVNLKILALGFRKSFCAAPRVQYALRTVPLPLTEEFSAGHDRAVLSCLTAVLSPGADFDSLPPLAAVTAQLALRHGGLGLRSAVRRHWASWADGLQFFARSEPAFAERLSASLAGSGSLPLALDSLRLAGHSLSAAGFELPAWQNLSRMLSPQQHDDDPGVDTAVTVCKKGNGCPNYLNNELTCDGLFFVGSDPPMFLTIKLGQASGNNASSLPKALLDVSNRSRA
ncbi:iolC [Symbiodinium pilosum]|uniref:IolC protein n=1 Tax=Symbiodinium pilosum TaxID=2952 RepID=A0A812KJX3_SYMPI|nr:iolC [Symbiodinium pilosum]